MLHWVNLLRFDQNMLTNDLPIAWPPLDDIQVRKPRGQCGNSCLQIQKQRHLLVEDGVAVFASWLVGLERKTEYCSSPPLDWVQQSLHSVEWFWYAKP